MAFSSSSHPAVAASSSGEVINHDLKMAKFFELIERHRKKTCIQELDTLIALKMNELWA